MLAVARAKVRSAEFHVADVESLPFADAEFGLAVISLALCHLADPTTAVVELGRVLRPGGSLVITDPHPAGELLGGQAFYGGIAPGRPMTWVRNHYHGASTWLRAFRHAGLTVTECHEVPFTDEQIAASPASLVYPEAAVGAMAGLPSVWVWHVTKPDT
jgi:ubiquinone/menaquinone biosynthesis C-methylase UbiE